MVAARRTVADVTQALGSSISISQAVSQITECLSQGKESRREFLKQAFCVLLGRIFGFSSAGSVAWLSYASQPGREADAKELVKLLAPDGMLMHTMFEVDQESQISFIFPEERLSACCQMILGAAGTPQGQMLIRDYLPHLQGKVNVLRGGGTAGLTGQGVQVRLSVFEFYMFWFAYYVLRPSDTNSGRSGSSKLPTSRTYASSTSQRSPLPYLSHAADLIHVGPIQNLIPHRDARSSKPYQELLARYLLAFLPLSTAPGGGSASGPAPGASMFPSPVSPSTMARSPDGWPTAGGGFNVSRGISRAETVLHLFLDFWVSGDMVEELWDVQASLSARAGLMLSPGGGPRPSKMGGGSPGGGGGMATPAMSSQGNAQLYSTVGGVSPLGHGAGYSNYNPATPFGVPGMPPPGASPLLMYQLPSGEQIESLALLVRHLGSSAELARLGQSASQGMGGGPPLDPKAWPRIQHLKGVPQLPWMSSRLQLPLFRFLHRGLSFWPVETSPHFGSLMRLLLTYLQPWATRPLVDPTQPSSSSSRRTPPSGAKPGRGWAEGLTSGLGELTHIASSFGSSPFRSGGGLFQSGGGDEAARGPGTPASGSTPGGGGGGGGGGASRGPFGPAWFPYVLANFSFYSVLVGLLLQLLSKLMFCDTSLALGYLCELLRVFRTSPGLLELLREMEAACAALSRAVMATSDPRQHTRGVAPLERQVAEVASIIQNQVKMWTPSYDRQGGARGPGRPSLSHHQYASPTSSPPHTSPTSRLQDMTTALIRPGMLSQAARAPWCLNFSPTAPRAVSPTWSTCCCCKRAMTWRSRGRARAPRP
eukprot:jgi/Mesvir1/14988/Mv14648-RA.1